MMKIKTTIPLVLVALLMFASFAIIAAPQLTEAEPTRTNPLYQLTESYNWSFAKPSLYTDTDANYAGHTNLKANTWDDVAIVIVLQDKHTTQVRENADPSGNLVDASDIYQTLFVPLNGTLMEAGTDQTILVEDFTATWCGYCTAVIGAMNRLDMDDEWFPEKYVGIEWHSGGGTYGTGTPLSSATSRRDEYGLGGGIPRYVIDGWKPYVGGNASPNVTSIDNRIKGDINTRAATDSPITISAKGGHSSTQAWVDFDIEVVDQNFDNALVEAYAFLVQDAYPRRHGTNTDAYLGWVGQASTSQRVFDIDGTIPSINDVLPAADSVLEGDVEISFTATDPDASDDKIVKTVSVREKGATTWGNIPVEGGKYMWHTAEKAGTNYVYEDGDYEIRVKAVDYWLEEAETIIEVSVRNPDLPLVNLKEYEMQQIIDDEAVRGTFEIMWNMMDDEDDTNLEVDIFYKSDSVIEWTPLVEDLSAVQSYLWDTTTVPDEEGYKLKVEVKDTDDMIASIEGSFRFEINNPDPPVVDVLYPPAGKEVSGTSSIKWMASDDEDSQQILKIDLFLSQDGGATYQPLGTGKPNSGTFSFDTTIFPDGENYKAKVRVIDTEEMWVEGETEIFYIYNNDQPTVDFLSPTQGDVVTGEIDITWEAEDQEDAEEELTYELYYMFETDSFWKMLTLDEPNTGSFTWDTSDLSEGDGVYTIKLKIMDKRGLESDTKTMYFEVYNPDEPAINNPQGPSGTIETTSTLSWLAYDPDPTESEDLKVWIYYRTMPEGEWMAVMDAQGIVNTQQFVMDVSEWEDGEYQVKLLISDCQPGDNNRTSEYIYPTFTVDNNDPPVVEFTQAPEPLSNNTETITLSWDGSDPENKGVSYSLSYREAGQTNWMPINGALKLVTTSFIWDVTDLEAGDYELRIVAVDGSRDKLEAEATTSAFEIWVAPTDTDTDTDTDNDTDSDKDAGDSSDGGISAGLIAVLAIVGLIVILGIVIAGVLVMKKNSQPAQMPPPGGLPPTGAPAMPPAQQQGLPPGQVQTGELPPQGGAAPQLPPPEQPPQA